MVTKTSASETRQQAAKERFFHIATRFDAETRFPTFRRERRVPAIRLSGVWLQQLGFARGKKVRIEAEPGRLVLTLAGK
jgi:Toxin SymE, type I toxin-antitoxin system